MIDKKNLKEAKRHLDKAHDEQWGYVYDYPNKVLKTFRELVNKTLAGELVEVMNIEEIDKKILKSISAYWKIEANDVGRELLVIPANRKQVCQAIHDRLKGGRQ